MLTFTTEATEDSEPKEQKTSYLCAAIIMTSSTTEGSTSGQDHDNSLQREEFNQRQEWHQVTVEVT